MREYLRMDRRTVAVVEGGEVFFVRTDHIGRPVFATDSDGLKVWEASYLPFGGVHVSTGAINLRFPGQWFQSESGLHQNWMRDNDPTTGRYIQADPLGLIDGASVYGYARQSPLMISDPTGQCPFCVAAAVGAVYGAAWSVGIGWFLDLAAGDGCYTWEELGRDALLGALGGAAAGAAAALAGNPAAQRALLAFLANESGAAQLPRALAAAGIIRAAGEHAHHVVAQGARLAAPARAKLAQLGIDLHSATNGVYLKASYHAGLHTRDYYQRVNALVSAATSQAHLVQILNSISRQLSAGKF